jgi:CBS domain-containing protein
MCQCWAGTGVDSERPSRFFVDSQFYPMRLGVSVEVLASVLMLIRRFVMKLHEFITTKIEWIDHDKSVYDAIEKMVDRRIRSLVVTFPGKEKEYGVITARDVVFKLLAKGIDPNGAKVSEIASKPLVYVDKDTELRGLAQSMQEANVARVFVCDGERVVGVVSLVDLMVATLVGRARGNEFS